MARKDQRTEVTLRSLLREYVDMRQRTSWDYSFEPIEFIRWARGEVEFTLEELGIALTELIKEGKVVLSVSNENRLVIKSPFK